MSKCNQICKQYGYTLGKQLGSGTYGTVYQAVHDETGATVAIKHMKLVTESKLHLRAAAREVDLLIKLTAMDNNRYTTKLLDAFHPEVSEPEQLDQLYLVLEYIPYDLADLLATGQNQLKEDQLITLTYNMLLCIQYLHSANVIHRDLKPANILIQKDCSVKLCDLGMARSLCPKKDGKPRRSQSPYCFTRCYRPPEVIVCQEKYDQSADTWSFGCILSEMIRVLLLESNTDEDDNTALFQGEQCFPISPKMNAKKEPVVDSQEQLIKVLEICSDGMDLPKDHFDREDMADFYDFCKGKAALKQTTLCDLHPECPANWMQFLSKILRFLPEDRISIQKCFELPIFKKHRNLVLEKAAHAPKTIDLKVDLLHVDPASGKEIPLKNKKYQGYLMKLVHKIRSDTD